MSLQPQRYLRVTFKSVRDRFPTVRLQRVPVYARHIRMFTNPDPWKPSGRFSSRTVATAWNKLPKVLLGCLRPVCSRPGLPYCPAVPRTLFLSVAFIQLRIRKRYSALTSALYVSSITHHYFQIVGNMLPQSPKRQGGYASCPLGIWKHLRAEKCLS